METCQFSINMKKLLPATLVALLFISTAQSQVSISSPSSAPDPSAMLDIKSTAKGVLVPRMAKDEMANLPAPANGLLIFNTSSSSFWYYKAGLGWTEIASEPGLKLPYAATENLATPLFSITNTGDGVSVEGINSSTTSSVYGIKGVISSTTPGGFSAGVRGLNMGTGGLGIGVYGSQAGSGYGVYGTTPTGIGVLGSSSGAGYGVYATGNTGTALVATSTSGAAADISIQNNTNHNSVLNMTTLGNGVVLNAATVGEGAVGNFVIDNTANFQPAVKGVTNSQFVSLGASGIYGESNGLGGTGGTFYMSNADGTGNALFARTLGTGHAVYASTIKTGSAIQAEVTGSGTAVRGVVMGLGTGRAASFLNMANTNTSPVLTAETRSGGDIAVFRSGNPAANVARINAAGKGFFNGGTQNSGADVAEAFDVTGEVTEYEAGDVLVISVNKDRAVEKSATPYSSLVAGVYATKPGVLLTQENIDSDLSDKVPMGVIGVIPTKVCLEGGVIARGDILVTSSIAGVAMKADPAKVKAGEVVGKALQACTSNGISKIEVLVSIR